MYIETLKENPDELANYKVWPSDTELVYDANSDTFSIKSLKANEGS